MSAPEGGAGAGARFICIGTHHKTGTIWMRKLWRAISAEQDIPFMQCYRDRKIDQAAERGPQIIVNWHSTFPPRLMEMAHARFIHIIRDPRDVLLSGMRYHLTAPTGNEKFLREARPEWGGKTYQEHLNALPDHRARLLFEMEHKHAETLREMLAWPYGHPRAADLRYEELIDDADCAIMRGVLERFAIEGLDIDRALATYWEKSLFGGLRREGTMEERQAGHIRSGTAAQWRRKLPREIAEIYAERHGAALRQLGYAEDDRWVAECPPLSEIAA